MVANTRRKHNFQLSLGVDSASLSASTSEAARMRIHIICRVLQRFNPLLPILPPEIALAANCRRRTGVAFPPASRHAAMHRKSRGSQYLD